MEDHEYIEFIKAVMQSGHSIQWDETTANITLRSGFKISANFSYNEPKIWFNICGRDIRVLDDGKIAAQMLDGINAVLMSLPSIISEYEG